MHSKVDSQCQMEKVMRRSAGMSLFMAQCACLCSKTRNELMNSLYQYQYEDTTTDEHKATQHSSRGYSPHQHEHTPP